MALDPADVSVNRSWMRQSNRGGRIARTSRASGLQTGYLELIHKPTKLSVKGTVAEGSYTRQQMSRAMDALHQQLLVELEDEVARKLRVRGRTTKGTCADGPVTRGSRNT
jgi:hypothetical protein